MSRWGRIAVHWPRRNPRSRLAKSAYGPTRPTGGQWRFNAPPNWPPSPPGWSPESGWQPDPSWPPPPSNWQFWVPLTESPRGASRTEDTFVIEQDRGEAELHILGKGLEERIKARLAPYASSEQRRAAEAAQRRADAQRRTESTEDTFVIEQDGGEAERHILGKGLEERIKARLALHASSEQRRAAEAAQRRAALAEAAQRRADAQRRAALAEAAQRRADAWAEVEKSAELAAPRGAIGERNSRVIPQDVKIAVAARDKGRCVQCGSTEDLHYDHKIPWSRGGSNTVNNIQLLCGLCNRRKGADDIPF